MPQPSLRVTGFRLADMRLPDRRNLLVCVLLPLAAIVLIWPVVEAGVRDDAAYIHMAKTLAATGRFAYNGWGAMTLGIQVWWAAAWIRLFGFSFTITRLSLLPLALAVPPLVYLLGRRARLSAKDSLFAALLTVGHEDYLDLAPTFMTDVSSLCLLLASLYGFSAAVDSADRDGRDPRIYAWLLLGMLCGILGGSIRQNVWFVLITGPAVLALRPGVGSTARVTAIACTAAGIACLSLGMRWYNAQPFAIPTTSAGMSLDGIVQTASGLPKLAFFTVAAAVLPAMTAVAFCLPALHLRRRPLWSFTAALVASSVTCLWLQRRAILHLGAAACRGSVTDGVMAAADIGIGTLSYLRWLGLMLLVCMLTRDLLTPASGVRRMARQLPPAIIVSMAYVAVYWLALTQYKTSSGDVYTRYFLLILPVLAWSILFWATFRHDGTPGPHRRRTAWGWLLIALAISDGVVKVHDHFATSRARLAALDFLLGQGVPRDRIWAGWDIDHWAQIDMTGHLNNPRIRNPAGAFRPFTTDGYPHEESMWFRCYSDAITPEYVIDVGPPKAVGDGTVFPIFPSDAWWPRSRRMIGIQHHEPSLSGNEGHRGER